MTRQRMRERFTEEERRRGAHLSVAENVAVRLLGRFSLALRKNGIKKLSCNQSAHLYAESAVLIGELLKYFDECLILGVEKKEGQWIGSIGGAIPEDESSEESIVD